MGRGDGGSAEFRGERIPKDDPRLIALGDLDELQAQIALASRLSNDGSIRDRLSLLVADIARAMEALASAQGSRSFPAEALVRLEASCAAFREGPSPSGFVLPGSNEAEARLHLCRTVARRAERSLVAASRLIDVPESLMAWVNRLSEWLFLAAADASGPLEASAAPSGRPDAKAAV
jgi:cob(I)alamin adenosyltransferase